MIKTYKFSWKGHSLLLGKRTAIMGILNVTPDSFSDGGRFLKCDNAVIHGEKLAEQGADIIDIGGESTRPFSDMVTAEDEIQRVVPVIEKLAKRISVPISIDTRKAGVAECAIEAGASIINDISSLRHDPDMAGVAAKHNVPVVLMHMHGTPKTMQLLPKYDNLIEEIKEFFENTIDYAEKNGISRSKIIVDPGIGFGKTVEHNLLILSRLDEFTCLDVPIMTGPSRKMFIRKILNDNAAENIKPDHDIVKTGTQAAIAAAVLHGAHIVRVHDVADTYSTLKIIDAIKNL